MRRAILLSLAVMLVFVAPCFIKQPVPFAPVAGISMSPVLEEGDLILYEDVSPSGVEVGDIVVYSVPSLVQKYYNCPPVVAHRVVEIRDTADGLYYRTRGDSNPAQDPWNVRHCDVMGKVTQRISYLGFLPLFFQSRPGLVFILITFFASALCLYADELSRVRWKLRLRPG